MIHSIRGGDSCCPSSNAETAEDSSADCSITALHRSFQQLIQQTQELEDWRKGQCTKGPLSPEIETVYQHRCDAITLELLAVGSKLCDSSATDLARMRMKASVLRYLLPEDADMVVQLAFSLCRDLSQPECLLR